MAACARAAAWEEALSLWHAQEGRGLGGFWGFGVWVFRVQGFKVSRFMGFRFRGLGSSGLGSSIAFSIGVL